MFSFTHLPPLAGNNKVNQWVFSLTCCHLDVCHLNNIYLKDSLWERKQMSMIGHMTSSEVYLYRTSCVWLTLNSGFVFHSLLPSLSLLLRDFKVDKFSIAFPVRLLLSPLCYFSIIIINLFNLNHFPMTSVHNKVNSTSCDLRPGQYVSSVVKCGRFRS